MKRIVTILLMLVLVLSLTIPTLAASVTVDVDPLAFNNSNTSGEYKAYKVFDADSINGAVVYSIAGDSPFYDTVRSEEMFSLNEIGTSGNYDVLYDSEKGSSILVAQLLNGVTDKGEPTASATVAEDTSRVLFTDLDPGYYLITDRTGGAIVVNALESPNSIVVSDKKERPSLTKSADKGIARIGEAVTFTVSVTIPPETTGEIVVHDTMEGLDYVALTTDSFAVTAAPAADDCTMHFTISAEQVANNCGKTIDVKYTAAFSANSATAKNTAYLTGNGFTSTPVTVDLAEQNKHTADVYKYTGSGDSKTGLAGAGFVLTNANGDYYRLDNGVVSWVSQPEQATELITTEDNGFTASFAGLYDGTYTLIEKTVPEGYNRAGDAEFTINGVDLTGERRIEVENNAGFELLSSGGIGTTVFYVVGGALVLVAAILLIIRKRAGDEEHYETNQKEDKLEQ